VVERKMILWVLGRQRG